MVTGGRAENQALLEQKFDKIFFTGGKAVGREVLRHAAEHLTPVTLELGGKSPCIVDATADLKLAAKRIVFGKYLNCGQTCVAPDYLYCQASVRDELVACIQNEITAQFGAEPLQNPRLRQDRQPQALRPHLRPDRPDQGGRRRPDRRTGAAHRPHRDDRRDL